MSLLRAAVTQHGREPTCFTFWRKEATGEIVLLQDGYISSGNTTTPASEPGTEWKSLPESRKSDSVKTQRLGAVVTLVSGGNGSSR